MRELYKVVYTFLKKTAYVVFEKEPVLGSHCVINIDDEKYFAKILEKTSIQKSSANLVREASKVDEEHYYAQSKRLVSVVKRLNEFAVSNKIECKVLSAEPLFDVGRVTFYCRSFVKSSKFRLIVKEARKLARTQIDFREVNGRDTAQVLNTVGACGRKACCSCFLLEKPKIIKEEVEDVWIRSQQSLGVCGRFKCCTRYEE